MSDHELQEKINELNQEIEHLKEVKATYNRSRRIFENQIADQGGERIANPNFIFGLEDSKRKIIETQNAIVDLESQLSTLINQSDPLKLLYDEANSYFDKKQWLEAIRKYRSILEQDQNYRDVADKTKNTIYQLYSMAIKEARAQKWDYALILLMEVKKLSPDYNDIDNQINIVQKEIDKISLEKKREQEEIDENNKKKIEQNNIYTEQKKKFSQAIQHINNEDYVMALHLLRSILDQRFEHVQKKNLINKVNERISEIELIKNDIDKKNEIFLQQKMNLAKAKVASDDGDFDLAMITLNDILKFNFDHKDKEKLIKLVNKEIERIQNIINIENEIKQQAIQENEDIFLKQNEILLKSKKLMNDGYIYEPLKLLNYILVREFDHPEKSKLIGKVVQDINKLEEIKRNSENFSLFGIYIKKSKFNFIENSFSREKQQKFTGFNPFEQYSQIKSDEWIDIIGYDPYKQYPKAEHKIEKDKKIEIIGFMVFVAVSTVTLCTIFFTVTYYNLKILQWITRFVVKDLYFSYFEMLVIFLGEVSWILGYILIDDHIISYKKIYKFKGFTASFPINIILTYSLSQIVAYFITSNILFRNIIFLLSFCILTTIGLYLLKKLDDEFR